MAMYRTEPIDPAITPKRNPAVDSLASAWNLVTGIHGELSCIQIDRKYVVSLGAHFLHADVLLSKKYGISFATARRICNYLTYLFDSPVIATLSLKKADCDRELRGLSRVFQNRGEVVCTYQDIQKLLSEQHELVAATRGQFVRYLPVVPKNNGRVLAFDLPADSHLADALLAYQQATFSIDPVGEILNYWRVLEATSRSVPERRALLGALASTRLQPVVCSSDFDLGETKIFNLITRQKRFIASHVKRLVARYGSPTKVIDFLYHHRRNPSAHAEEGALGSDSSAPLRELYYDALLLKLLARLSVERYYSTLSF